MAGGDAPKTASPLQVAKAVFWSFFGIRRRSEHESDALQLKPAQVVVAGLIGAAIFVLSLVLLVRFIISRAA
jgi:preprotein translocase subunit Sec61beta